MSLIKPGTKLRQIPFLKSDILAISSRKKPENIRNFGTISAAKRPRIIVINKKGISTRYIEVFLSFSFLYIQTDIFT
jgi:hypothetical protein